MGAGVGTLTAGAGGSVWAGGGGVVHPANHRVTAAAAAPAQPRLNQPQRGKGTRFAVADIGMVEGGQKRRHASVLAWRHCARLSCDTQGATRCRVAVRKSAALGSRAGHGLLRDFGGRRLRARVRAGREVVCALFAGEESTPVIGACRRALVWQCRGAPGRTGLRRSRYAARVRASTG